MPLILMFFKIQNDYFKDYQFFFEISRTKIEPNANFIGQKV
jgi:hypothetical protein